MILTSVSYLYLPQHRALQQITLQQRDGRRRASRLPLSLGAAIAAYSQMRTSPKPSLREMAESLSTSRGTQFVPARILFALNPSFAAGRFLRPCPRCRGRPGTPSRGSNPWSLSKGPGARSPRRRGPRNRSTPSCPSRSRHHRTSSPTKRRLCRRPHRGPLR